MNVRGRRTSDFTGVLNIDALAYDSLEPHRHLSAPTKQPVTSRAILGSVDEQGATAQGSKVRDQIHDRGVGLLPQYSWIASAEYSLATQVLRST